MRTFGQPKLRVVRSSNDPVDSLLERGELFRLLALAFAYPVEDRVVEVRETLSRLAGRGRASNDRIACRLRSADRAWRRCDSEALGDDYRRLFCSATPVALHESAHCSGKLSVRATELADIVALYRTFGFNRTQSGGEMPDHACTELDFVALLLLREAHARRRGLTAQAQTVNHALRQFLERHIGRWIERVARVVVDQSQEDSYRELAMLLALAVAMECRYRHVRRAAPPTLRPVD